MGLTLDLGRRIELVSMDAHCLNITIGLYEQDGGYLVHSYSGFAEAAARLEAIREAMRALGGLELRDGWLRFPCGVRHSLAMRRVFLEACKLPSDAAKEARAAEVADKKIERTVVVRGISDGVYEVTAEGPAEAVAARLEAIAGGFRKLAEAEIVDGHANRFRFGCGQAHDALVGLLLARALNVRAALREQEMSAARGTLVAPSAQK